MKKIIITVLTFTLVITAFSSCVKTEETTTSEPITEFPTEASTLEASATEESTAEVPTTEVPTTQAPVTEATTKVPETTTKAPETTTKPVETTTKVPETTTNKSEVTTEKEEVPTKLIEEVTKPQVDINIRGPKDEKSPERAGLIYNGEGLLSTYDDLPEGYYYFEYDENGNFMKKYKPYSPGNEPEYDIYTCEYCGKHSQPYDGEHYASYYGYCDRWWSDINCPECGVFVKANTCHSCK